MPYLQSKVPEMMGKQNVTLEKLYKAYLDLFDYTALQRRELDYLLTHLNGDNIQNVLDILDRRGLNPAFIKWFKNMCWNSSFELFDPVELVPTYWNGGASTANSNFYGTYSMKLDVGESSAQTDEARVNPQWYATFVDADGNSCTKTRVSFHKKGGAVKLEVFDELDNAFTITNTDKETGTYLTYAANSNWESESYSVSLVHGANTSIRVKFTNTDGADAAYIDAVIIEPDYTGKHPSSYTDGPFSYGSGLVAGYSGEGSNFVYATNAAQVDVVSASETTAATKTITFPQRSKVIIHFSCECTIVTGAANLTAKTYVDGSAQTFAPTMYCDSSNVFTLAYTTYATGIEAGEKTILVKLQTSANTGTVAISHAVLVIQIFADPSPYSGGEPTDGYLMGGYGSELQDTDEYNPDTWTNKTDMPAPARYANAATAILLKIYSFCGRLGGSDVADNDEYTPDTWVSKTDGNAKSSLAASTISNKGYIYGGEAIGYSQVCAEYVPDVWTGKTNLPNPVRGKLAAGTILSKGYVFCGITTSSVPLQDTDEYTPDTWASKTDAPNPARFTLCAFVLSSKAYIVNGYIVGGSTKLQDNDQYAPDTWTSKTSCPTPERAYTSGFKCDGKGYIACGSGDGSIRDCDEYTAASDSWANKTDAPLPARWAAAAASI
jgi:hypothetical protein